jgi:hypothetical protein
MNRQAFDKAVEIPKTNHFYSLSAIGRLVLPFLLLNLPTWIRLNGSQVHS